MSLSKEFFDWFDQTISPQVANVKDKPMRYGQKGGDGPNTGKKATTYRFTFPDGTIGKKRSFEVDGETATVGVYQDRDGKWCAAGVAACGVVVIDGVERPLYYQPNGYGSGQIVVTGTRVEKKR